MTRRLAPLLAALALAACATGSAGSSDGGAPPPPDLAGKDADTRKFNVLFVGNSYTYVNDLPAQVKSLVASAPGAPAFTVESVTVGGATLQAHYETTGALAKIRGGGFTHVVLQGQSVEPVLDSGNFLDYAERLGVEVRQAGAEAVYFETWARRAGDAVYMEAWSGGSPAAMQKGLRDAYLLAAVSGGGTVAPVGDAWEKALAQASPPDLYDPDGSHPSTRGTYLAGCVFVRKLLGVPSAGRGARPSGVGEAEAAALQKIADEVALP